MPDSPTSEAESVFVCECDPWFRSACAGEPFYKEHEGKRHCVLHFPCKEKSTDFKEVFQRKLNNEDFNFRGLWFPDEVLFIGYDFNAEADFVGATFNEPAHFTRAEFRAPAGFSHATFTSDTYFDGATFRGEAFFGGSSFVGETYFNAATFSEQVDFSRATFRAMTNFNSVTFKAPADFSRATFSAQAHFLKAAFSTLVNFASANFSEAVDFGSATFSGEAYFGLAKFRAAVHFNSAFLGKADFSSATFNAAAFFNSAAFGKSADFCFVKFTWVASFRFATFSAKADFAHATFGMMDFSFATFNDRLRFEGSGKFGGLGKNYVFPTIRSLDLQFAEFASPEHVTFQTVVLRPSWFLNVDARRFKFHNVDWNWRSISEEVQSVRRNKIEAPHRMLEIACRHLAVNAEENHRYEEASKFRYLAMDARRKEKWRGNLAFWKLSWWYWIASGYGERPFQALAVLFGILLGFAVLYTQVGFARWEPRIASEEDVAVAKRDEIGASLKFSRALTYSAAVMTLQRPEPKPATTAAQTLVLLETILGPVQAALLALAIRRKFMR